MCCIGCVKRNRFHVLRPKNFSSTLSFFVVQNKIIQGRNNFFSSADTWVGEAASTDNTPRTLRYGDYEDSVGFYVIFFWAFWGNFRGQVPKTDSRGCSDGYLRYYIVVTLMRFYWRLYVSICRPERSVGFVTQCVGSH